MNQKGLDLLLSHIHPFVSADTTAQKNSKILFNSVFIDDNTKILDFGCGKGSSIDTCELLNKNVQWKKFLVGVDIVNENQNPDLSNFIFDGMRTPFKDSSFDIVYCNQVLEHVRYPDKVIFEIRRILKEDGFFIGSVSHTEPYHALSIFNWTPYGLIQVFLSSGFNNIRIYPGIDSITLLIRRLCFGKFGNYFFYHESPVNFFIGIIGKIIGYSPKRINAMKLSFCGQLTFCARK